MLKEGLQKIADSKSKMFLAFCFCFILGAGSFSFLENTKSLFYLYVGSFAILFFIIIFWSKFFYRFLLLCLFVFILGGLRFLISIPDKNSDRIEFYNGNKKIVSGFVVREPDIRIADARYVVKVESIADQPVIPTTRSPRSVQATEESLSKSKTGQRFFGRNPQDDSQAKRVSGNIILKTRLYPQYAYGDKLEVHCSLQEPINSEDGTFNYRKYLAKQDVWSICTNPQIKKLGGNKGNLVVKIILNFKNSIQSHIARLWPEPHSSLIAGILYGSRSGLPEELTDNFSRTGVTHIVAVSGYNVSIIVVVLNALLIRIGLYRKQSFWSLVFLILAFVFFTGASASVVRAGVMAIVVLISQYVGRLSAVGRVLVYTVVVMLFFNPYLLLWDAGFQLSFLSTLGLVYLSPIIKKFIDDHIQIKNEVVESLLEVLITTIAAIIATMPLILYQFGRLSVVAPLVNVLILWIVPWLMLFGFISLVLSFIFFSLGQLVAWVTGLGVQYVIMVVNWFGDRSWSALDVRIPLWVMIGMYALLIYVIARSEATK